MSTVYEIVTQKIIDKLERGVIPWRKPWATKRGEVAHNWVSGRPYTGINAMLLDTGEYATYKQIQAAGGQVKKGEKSHLVVFYKMLESTEDEDKKIPYLRYYNVFEINTQCEGLKSRFVPVPEETRAPVESAEAIINAYKDAPKVNHGGGRACYFPSRDVIEMPKRATFAQIEGYYGALFHEMAHSTGHKDRLARAGIMETSFFCSVTYSKEELVAEIGAAMLCSISGIGFETLDNSAAYINNWLRKLKEDSRMVVTAAGQAQKAADWIQGIKAESKK